jgi:hypothetical protein
MVTLPKEFVATKYPGYFWNTLNKQLYSVKVTGELKPLVKTTPNMFNHYQEEGWRVSVKGERRYLQLSHLLKLTPANSVFPVAKV